jgi:hypothetical protein
MADEKPKTVKVESIEWHTYEGKEYPVGATYDIDEQLVDSVQAQGKAVPVDRVSRAKAAEKAGAESQQRQQLGDKQMRASAAKAGRSKTAVAPMTIDTTAPASPLTPRRTIRAAKAPKRSAKKSRR